MSLAEVVKLLALLACTAGLDWLCGPSPIARFAGGAEPLLAGGTRAARFLECPVAYGGGIVHQVPAALALDRETPWMVLGAEVFRERSRPALPLDEEGVEIVVPRPAELVRAGDGKTLRITEWSDTARSWHLVHVEPRGDEVRIRRERLVALAPGGEHGFGEERPVEPRERYASAPWWSEHIGGETRVVRVAEGRDETIRCRVMAGGEKTYEERWRAWLAAGG